MSDFMRVPKPAARIKTSTGLFGLLIEGDDIRIQFIRHLRGGKLVRAVLRSTVDYSPGEAFRIVTHHFSFVQQVGTDDLNAIIARLCVGSSLEQHLHCSIGCVNLSLCGANGTVINDRVIEVNLGSVSPDRCQVFAKSIAVGLAWLGH